MEQVFDFDSIRPYEGEEVAAAAARLCEEPLFYKAVSHIISDMDSFLSVLRNCRTVRDFQVQLAFPVLNMLVEKMSNGLTSDGFANLARNGCYTYVSNHRDITLDSAFLNLVLYKSGFDTCEIAIGDNLLIYPWIVDFVRLNKSFIVNRSVSRRQMLEVSMRLSAYMHHAVREKRQSVWIAQREGRAKNSDDCTQESIVKMFALAGGGDLMENIRSLNIVPVAISYEYDPCDFLKAKEMQLKRDDADYRKQPSDDLTNMATGIVGYKGQIHFEAAAPLNESLAARLSELPRTEAVAEVAHLIDTSIHSHYRLYAGNYVAYDELWGAGSMTEHYTPDERETFDRYVRQQVAKIDLPQKDEPFLRERILEMYANPVRNFLKAKAL